MKKKIVIMLSLLAMIFSVNSAVDPFHFKGHGAEKICDGAVHTLYYVTTSGKAAAIQIFSPIKAEYFFNGKRGEVYSFAWFLKQNLGYNLEGISIEKDTDAKTGKSKYFGRFENKDFVEDLNSAQNFLGIDLA